MTYEAVGTVQMNFLRILSEEARQNFTYTCINSVAWYSSKTDSYDLSIKLMSANEMELGHDTTSPYINVLADGCQVSNNPVWFSQMAKNWIFNTFYCFSVWQEQK